MASKHGPVTTVTSDGLPAGLVILTDESVPIHLNPQLGDERTNVLQAALGEREVSQALRRVEGDHDQDGVEFCESMESHGITMVSTPSHNGGYFEESDRVDEDAIINWLQDIIVEDDYGKIDCKVMIELVQKEFGSKRRKTRAWLKKAFPKSYLRRSDRSRWFCGVSFKSDRGKPVISVKDKEWIDRAVSWLSSSMEMNPTVKERCSDVHQALTQHVGPAAVHLAISAVKMVFTNIPRKTYSRTAFYVGIRFKDPSLGHGSVQSAANTLTYLSDIKTEYSDSAANKLVIAWLQKALVADNTKRETIKLVGLSIQKRFGKSLPHAKVARLVKKIFPNVTVKLKGPAGGIIWGVHIDSAYRPTSKWMQKATAWIRELYEPAELSYCENAAVLFDLIAQRLSIGKQSKAISLLQEAFPDMQYKEVGDCQMLFGIRPKNNVEDVEFPEFTEEEDSLSDEVLHCLDGNSSMNEALNKRVSREQLANTNSTGASTPASYAVTSSSAYVHDSELQPKSASVDIKVGTMWELFKSFQGVVQEELSGMNKKLVRVEKNMSEIAKDISQIKDEVSKLIKDNAKSAQQKDSLIIQLQQTLIMLCQQQLQKFIPGDQTFPEQALSTLLQKGIVNQGETSES